MKILHPPPPNHHRHIGAKWSSQLWSMERKKSQHMRRQRIVSQPPVTEQPPWPELCILQKHYHRCFYYCHFHRGDNIWHFHYEDTNWSCKETASLFFVINTSQAFAHKKNTKKKVSHSCFALAGVWKAWHCHSNTVSMVGWSNLSDYNLSGWRNPEKKKKK